MHKALYFAFGVAVGAGASWYFWKEYHRKRADEEIQSVKEAFASKKAEEVKSEKKEVQMTVDLEADSVAYEKERQSKLQDYRALVRESGYQTRTSPKDLLEDDPNEQTPGDSITKPYVIKPEEFDTLDNYDAVCYTYYADGVLVDEDEDPLEIPEIATSIGLDFASHFGDYDEDSVHIRNDLRHIDYEIVRDLRKYGDFHESE